MKSERQTAATPRAMAKRSAVVHERGRHEVDIRGNHWVHGYPREEELISRELYRLLTIFASTGVLSARGKHGADVYLRSRDSFEYAEIARILVSVAAMIRSSTDAGAGPGEEYLSFVEPDSTVGTLVADISSPTRRAVRLEWRESLNKILHAYAINLEYGKAPRVATPRSNPHVVFGRLNPLVHLYGEHRGKHWKATLDIYRWAEVMHHFA